VAEEFEDQDLSDAVFWGVDLRRARFRDVFLDGATITHARLVDVTIDGLVERLVVNGVDVTEYVNERDQWYPLRAMLEPTDPGGLLAARNALDEAWAAAIEQAATLSDDRRHASVDGEWSFVQTLQHLVFATDKWFSLPVLGDTAFNPAGLPNTGSRDFPWPGLDLAATPSFDELVAARAEQSRRQQVFIDTVTTDQLAGTTTVLENGEATVQGCLHVVFEEDFQHLRYARRDLAVLVRK
jgi:hypothetical protein